MAMENLVVTDAQGGNPVSLPRVFTRENIPFGDCTIPVPDRIRRYDVLRELADEIPQYDSQSVDLLIGVSCPLALELLQVVSDSRSCPLVAIRLRHGWTLLGPTAGDPGNSVSNFRCAVQQQHAELIAPPMSSYDSDFRDCLSHDKLAPSKQDQKFLKIVQENITFDDGHYVIPLPLKDDPHLALPNNCSQALKRLFWQREKMKDPGYYIDYVKFMRKMMGYCERAPDASTVHPGRLCIFPIMEYITSTNQGKFVWFSTVAHATMVCP
jgi:hypothetical protein